MRRLLLLLALLPLFVKGQDLTGYWKGKIFQGPGGYSPEYVLELQINQHENLLTGVSNAFLGNVIIERLAFKGYIDGDSIRLKEYENGIIKSIQPKDYTLCIKNFDLHYAKEADGTETLKGRWSGVGYDENKLDDIYPNTCIPGLVSLTRIRGVQMDGYEPKPIFNFPDTLYETKVNKVEEIEVHHRTIELFLNDYEKVDGDKVSIYLNRQKIVDHFPIRKIPKKITVTLSEESPLNEILIQAENLGRIPPNTSLMKIKDGNKEYKVYISSDLKTTAAVYIKYKGS